MKPGTRFETNSNGPLTVTKYINSRSVIVEFCDTGYVTTVPSGDIRRGRVRDRLRPSVCGVGFIGAGVYSSKDKEIYFAWSGMLMRCYCSKYQKKYPTYIGCTVSSVWCNFQNFAKWYVDNKPTEVGKFHVDKDLKFKNNKLYSPETCTLVEPSENVAKATSKHHILISPNGVKVKVFNLMEFCRNNNLTYRTMMVVKKGGQTHHKQWRFANV
ncbi:putative portal protein [Vibrio phage 489E54-1]|nr:putative portal protein [Vibrio phage 489E54-1]